MANKVLGITVDIEGKTSGLTTSLKEANSAINKTTSALKDIDKALQLDPTNVESIYTPNGRYAAYFSFGDFSSTGNILRHPCVI